MPTPREFWWAVVLWLNLEIFVISAVLIFSGTLDLQ